MCLQGISNLNVYCQFFLSLFKVYSTGGNTVLCFHAGFISEYSFDLYDKYGVACLTNRSAMLLLIMTQLP